MSKLQNILDSMHEYDMYDGGEMPLNVFATLSLCSRTHTACIISVRKKENAWTVISASDDKRIIKIRARRLMLQYTRIVYISPRGRAHFITNDDKVYNYDFIREKLSMRTRNNAIASEYDKANALRECTKRTAFDDAQPDIRRKRRKHRVKPSVPVRTISRPVVFSITKRN